MKKKMRIGIAFSVNGNIRYCEYADGYSSFSRQYVDRSLQVTDQIISKEYQIKYWFFYS